MSEHSAISWTSATWNPVTGCSKVSDGCSFCYAETLSLRMGWSEKPWAAPYAAENVKLHPDRLDVPLRWKKPRMIFVNSMSDLFHEQVPFDFIDAVFRTICKCGGRHIFQILTKRPARMLEWFSHAKRSESGWFDSHGTFDLWQTWFGVSVENQRAAEERIPLLLQAPARVRFLSCEPLLESLNLTALTHRGLLKEVSPGVDLPVNLTINTLTGAWFDGWDSDVADDQHIHWVIVGGESGLHLRSYPERAMQMRWAREIRDQCAACGVPFFFKQDSDLRPGQRPYLVEEDGSRTLYHEFPKAAERWVTA